jgi:hypothetical protein
MVTSASEDAKTAVQSTVRRRGRPGAAQSRTGQGVVVLVTPPLLMTATT